MARVLGLSFLFHDSAAAIVVDGTVVAACAEERLTRRKHTSEFPKYALQYCLEAAAVASINDIDAVVFYEKPLVKLGRVVESLVGAWPRGLRTFATRFPEFVSHKTNVYRIIEQALPDYRGEILFSDHHLSHAAAAFLCSPFERAAILTVDGVGERETTTLGFGDSSGITLSKVLHFPHSIGLLYSALTGYLGFRVNDGEWKVMGLAPYGQPAYLERLRTLVNVQDDGSCALDMRYFVHDSSSTAIAHTSRWEQLLGFPPRQPTDELLGRHQDLARSGQMLAEEILLKIAGEARRMTGCENLVIGGGVALNSVANWKIEQSGLFENVWIHPAPGDDGAAVGAALAVSKYIYGDPAPGEMQDVYLGPAFSQDDVERCLDQQQQSFTSLDDAALVEATADLIADGKIVGWCRGRSEFGPRSLGNRSILGHAGIPDMKARINQRVKFREYFRPFAPSVPLDEVHDYFDVPPGCRLPFMIKVPQVRADKRALIPAVTHEDGSGRVQTVEPQSNPIYYQLLKAVGRRTGISVVVNTSFNVRGEPIVCSPEDALRTFRLAGLDALVVENCLIIKAASAEVNEEAGFAASDQLERAMGDSRAVVLDATSYFHYPNAIDVAADVRRRRMRRRHRGAHAGLCAVERGRALCRGVGVGDVANALSFHYALDVTGLEPHGPRRRHAEAVARLLVGQGSARFVASAAEVPDAPFDVMAESCGSDLGACLVQWAAIRGMLSRRGWVRFEAASRDGSMSGSERQVMSAHGLEIVSTEWRRDDGRIIVWGHAKHDGA